MSVPDVPGEIEPVVKTKLERVIWQNKRGKIKRAASYQDQQNSAICMVDIEIVLHGSKTSLETIHHKQWVT